MVLADGGCSRSASTGLSDLYRIRTEGCQVNSQMKSTTSTLGLISVYWPFRDLQSLRFEVLKADSHYDRYLLDFHL
jgi:hypothetical protein